MKLTSVEIHSGNSSDTVVLSFRDPRALNPYNVKSILGLDAESILPRSYGPAGSSNFYELYLENRVIVIKVGLNPSFSNNQSYSDLRDALYKLIASSRTGQLQLQFKDGLEVIAVLYGTVAKFESPQFERLQEIQLTINCSDSMLRSLTPIDVDVSAIDLSNALVTDNRSTAPHGFIFEMAITSIIPSLVITDPTDTSWKFEITPNDGFVVGDVLYFSSEANKYLYLINGTTTTYLADVIGSGSVWPIIFPGDNAFSFTNPTSITLNKLSYFTSYWGV